MRILTNEKLIKRNARIGQVTSLIGLALLIYGAYLSFTDISQVGPSLGAMLLGFAVSQIGIYLGNRYARRPRPDEALNQALKGLDKNHSLYHYLSPVTHLLVGPTGIWALFPKYQRGTISYEKGRWRQRGNLFLNYLKLFAQEGLGRPDLEIEAELETLKKALAKELPDVSLPEPQAVLLFYHPEVDLQTKGAPVPALKTGKLKDLIRKQAKQKKMSQSRVEAIRQVLGGEGESEETPEE